MRIRGGEFSTGTMGNFQPELTADQNSLLFLGDCGDSLRDQTVSADTC